MIASFIPRKRLFLLSLLLLYLCVFHIQPVQAGILTTEGRDLVMSHTISHDRVAVGDAVNLIFSLSNHDPHAARDIQILVDLPEGAFIASFSSERGELLENEGVWIINELEGGHDVSLQFSLLNASHVDLAFSASIQSARPLLDPVQENNVTQGVIRVQEEDCTVVYNDFSGDSNDSSYLYIDCIKEYPNNVLYIYDRWGNLVFEQERYDNTWNGNRHPRYTKYGWDKLPTGTYYYVLNFPEADRDDKSGWIYLSE